jgi:hypothetical protein
MQKSDSIKNLAAALITFHSKVSKIKKDASNPFFKSKYASLSNIQTEIETPLIESGLCYSQLPTGEYGLTTMLMHAESGEFIQSDYTMKPVKDDPQGRGSTITYQKRYALAALLGLNIDDDDDGNAGSGLGDKGNSQPSAKNNDQAPDGKQWLNKLGPDKKTETEDWKKVVAALSAGKCDLAYVESKYRLSKAVKEELHKLVKPAA